MATEAGIVVICVVVVVALWLLYKQQITAGGFFGVLLAGTLAGAVVAGLPRLLSFGLKAGTTTSVDITLQEVKETAQQVNTKAQQVQTDVDEVRQMKEQIEALVKRVGQGEKNVASMRDNVRQAYRSLFQSLAYVILTRNLFPPPENIMKEMERHINLLAEFAYPDPQERVATIQKITESAKAAQPQIPQPK